MQWAISARAVQEETKQALINSSRPGIHIPPMFSKSGSLWRQHVTPMYTKKMPTQKSLCVNKNFDPLSSPSSAIHALNVVVQLRLLLF